jgi:hypothetical protein
MSRNRGRIAFVLVIAVLVCFSILTGTMLHEHSEQRERETSQECEDQGGKVITLDEYEYCLIDGEKIRF